MAKPYWDSEARVWVRAGERADPEIVARVRMNEWVDTHVTRTTPEQRKLDKERNWDYYKHGRERTFPKPDLRHKGWKEASGTRG